MLKKNKNMTRWSDLVLRMEKAIEIDRFNMLIGISNIKRLLKRCNEDEVGVIQNEAKEKGGLIEEAFKRSLVDTNTK